MVRQHLVTAINSRNWIVAVSHNVDLLFFFSKVISNGNNLWCVCIRNRKNITLVFPFTNILGFPAVTSFWFPFRSFLSVPVTYVLFSKEIWLKQPSCSNYQWTCGSLYWKTGSSVLLHYNSCNLTKAVLIIETLTTICLNG